MTNFEKYKSELVNEIKNGNGSSVDDKFALRTVMRKHSDEASWDLIKILEWYMKEAK